MTISIGSKLPDGTLRVITPDGPDDQAASAIYAGKTVVLVGLPGAFTPTCNDHHVPGYLDNADSLKAKGVDAIYILSANDHFVMRAWAKSLGADGKATMIADWNAAYATALGLNIDLSGGGLGMRAKRFSLLAKDGEVVAVNVEDSPGEVSTTSAAVMLETLG